MVTIIARHHGCVHSIFAYVAPLNAITAIITSLSLQICNVKFTHPCTPPERGLFPDRSRGQVYSPLERGSVFQLRRLDLNEAKPNDSNYSCPICETRYIKKKDLTQLLPLFYDSFLL